MTDPKQPDDHPVNGVPAGASEAEAKGLPTSDRQATETAAIPDKQQPS